MEINFDKIELENLINVVDCVKRTSDAHDYQLLNINAATVICGDKEVKNVSFHIEYNMSDRLTHLHVEDCTWNIFWRNNDIPMTAVKKLFTKKIAIVGKDDEFNNMYKKITNNDYTVTYYEYIGYVKNYILKLSLI